jgi:hypothetical protein
MLVHNPVVYLLIELYEGWFVTSMKWVRIIDMDANKMESILELVSDRAEADRKLITALVELLIDVICRERHGTLPPKRVVVKLLF